MNPDPLVRLIGRANKSEIVVDDTKCLELIDSAAQLSSITVTFAQQLGLEIHHLHKILKLESMGGGNIPYMGYVEINQKILEIGAFKEDVLMLVIEDSPFAQKVPVQLGTLHIDRALDLVSETEMINLSNKWRKGRLATLLAGKSTKTGMVNNKSFTLDQVKGKVKLTKAMETSASETVHAQEISKVRGHQQ